MKKIPGRVFYVTSDKDNTVLMGLDLVVDGPWVRWFDTVKERVMKAETMDDQSPVRFSFVRAVAEGGGRYEFVPLTLETYEQVVKHHVLIAKTFTDEEAMLQAIEKTRSSAW